MTFPLTLSLRSAIWADADRAELSEGLGELVAQPLIVLGRFPVASGGGLHPRSREASLVRWCAGTGVPGARRPRSRSRWISARMSGWV